MAELYRVIEKTIRDFLSTIKNEPICTDSKNIINELPTYKMYFQMKCVFIGKLSTGKTTIINALLNKECLPTGSTEVTVCFFTIEATNKDYEYFQITKRICGLASSENKNISELKIIKRQNYDVTHFPDTETIIKIYLDKDNEILKNGMILVDCPGYDRGYVETIQHLCKDADIINVVIDINEGITEAAANVIKEISLVFKSGPTTFIYNKCENISKKDKEIAIENIKKHFNINSRFKYTESEKQIFFISALTPERELANDEEFIKFKRFIENQTPIIDFSRKNGIVQLASKIKGLADKIEKSIPLINDSQLRDTKNTKQSRMEETSNLSDLQITELFNKIDQTADANPFMCYKDKADVKVASICDDVNEMISKYLEQSCLSKNEIIIVPDGEATRNAHDIFYQTVFVASKIKINNYSWYNSGDKTTEVQTNFKKYLHESANECNYKNIIKSHYKEKMATFLDCALRERNENIKYWNALTQLVDKFRKVPDGDIEFSKSINDAVS